MATQKTGTPSAPRGFGDGDSFQYDGKLDSVPDWVDKGWATYDRGPALAVPKGDPWGQPYATDTCRIGDYIFTNKNHDRFTVIPASTIGDQPGDPDNPPTSEKPLPAKPVGTEQASLEDLDRTDILPYDDMNEEQQSQMRARGTLPGEVKKKEAEENAQASEARTSEASAPSRRRRSSSDE